MNEKLTAYALNELPPDERAALEQQMTLDPALREEAEAMKVFCSLLKEQVGEHTGQSAPEQEELTGDQRNQVLKAFLNTPRKVVRPPFWKRAEFISTAIAAGLALTLLVPSGVLIERKQDMPEAAARSNASEEITVTRAEPALKDLESAVKQKNRTLPAEARSSSVADKVELQDDRFMGTTDAEGAGRKSLLGDVPAAPLALPTPPPAPISAPQPATGGRGAGSGSGLGAVESKKEQSEKGGWKANTAPAPESAGSVAPSPPPSGVAGYMLDSQAPARTFKAKEAQLSEMPVDPMERAKQTAAAAPTSSSPTTPATPALTTASKAPAPAPAKPLAKMVPSTRTTGGVAAAGASPAPAAAPAAPAAPSNPDPLAAAPAMLDAVPQLDMPADGASLRARQPAQPAAGAQPQSGVTITAGSNFYVGTDLTKTDKSKPAGAFAGSYLEAPDKDGTEALRRRESASAGETYTPIYENPFQAVAQEPLSTFSIDVDTASYANVRRFLNSGQRPPADAVRLEELINYFPYAYEPPADDKPFAVQVDMAEAPWKPEHRLARIAIKGRVNQQERAPANFVFLVDVSGSMDEPDKLPLVKQSLRMLTERLSTKDRVAIVTYAGSTAVTLSSTAGTEKSRIIEAIDGLGAGGSTNGAGGIRLAYEQAQQHFQKEGVNRVILCTDGDFNVGISSPEELQKLIEEKAKSRVFLSVLGFGTGNLKDRTMETLADKGNGNYAYIDSLSEARKVLVEQMNATLVTIAKDVKIQVEFNPAQVQAYRLLGYENRVLAKQDFNNDRKDAGEIGEGHTVTALYEIVPSNVKFPDGRPLVDDLKYANNPAAPAAMPAEAAKSAPASNETMTVKLRYKQPLADTSVLMEVPVVDKEKKMADAPGDFKFAASVAGFGMMLRNSQHTGELTWEQIRQLALAGKGSDDLGYRGEFLQLIDKARGIVTDRPQ
ncbi:von Willebrand factor type A domain-containing protein [Verrucomicrobium sp. BvORR034]|uniref:YfbK domain-containing protein n=1 Tax=Verrucomicrobium sp. BvORR034 TaxID=1396418 RepID=UPI00067995B9|nr:von Willebrand factor type A domain-containing protein [Verrucomicrobium sp. BvORR034]